MAGALATERVGVDAADLLASIATGLPHARPAAFAAQTRNARSPLAGTEPGIANGAWRRTTFARVRFPAEDAYSWVTAFQAGRFDKEPPMIDAAKYAVALALGLALPAGAQKAAPPGDACKLLTDAEVRKVFPQAESGKRRTAVEQYGIAGCTWKHAGGMLGVNYWDKTDAIDVEIRSVVDGFVDPLKPGSEKNVRMIKVTGLGDAAMGFAEPRSEARGVHAPIALLMVQRGGRQITLFSNQLAGESDRDAAMKALQELGRAAAGRI